MKFRNNKKYNLRLMESHVIRILQQYLFVLIACFACVGHVDAQIVPTDSPIRIVVGFAPGGATDRIARIVAEKLQTKLHIAVIVENKTGAGGRVAAQIVKSTHSNQVQLMLANPAVMVVAPLVFQDNGYDAENDFVPVSQVNSYEFGLAVEPSMPVSDLTGLLDWLRSHAGQANIGVPATGSLPHFFALMMADKTQVQTQVVGYRGSAPLMNDLIGKQMPVAIDILDTLWPQHEAGKLKILAVSGVQRAPFAPDIPTFSQAGLNITATGWNTFFAPKSLPQDKLLQLSEAIREVMQDPETQRTFVAGKLTPVISTQAQTQTMLNNYRAQWAPVVTRSGFQP
jgi:tripartite-type tricarboxylate transporter receptor subunit TctC